jgi:phospholipid/cholesterol/gamma-HCH transport system permease protein
MIHAIAWIGKLGIYCFRLFWAVLRYGVPLRRVVEESYRIGVQSLPVLLVINGFIGSILVIQGYISFAPLGGQQLVGMFVGLAGVREAAPLMAATMIAAKAGTEMASQIAVMNTREQVDALEVMAVNPLAWLVGPRLLGILLVMPVMTTIAIATTVVAGWAVAQLQLGLDGYQYFLLVQRTLSPLDLMVAQVKALSFGAVICLVSTFCGFVAPRGPEGVGQATNTAVVVCAVISVSINFLISQVAYGR